jgi:hypothetical protein
MVGLTDGWLGGSMDGWMDRWMDGQTDGWMDRCVLHIEFIIFSVLLTYLWARGSLTDFLFVFLKP